jgi:DNA-binding NarL/FixJ family response regulator
MIRILLVDDHAVVRAGYRRLIESVPGYTVVAEAASGAAGYRRALEGGVDVVVMDLSLPGVGGLEVTRRLNRRRPELRILVFSVHEESVFVQRALQAGAAGYLSKRSAAEQMIDALQAVAAGQRYLDPVLQARGAPDTRLQSLSQREFEIFRQIAAGRSVRQIAADLHLSDKTVANYNTQVRQKLGASSAADLARVTIAAGVVRV